MLRPPVFPLVLALAAAAALALAGCGEEDAQLLPGQTAREITVNLDTVQQLSGEGDCVGAEGAARQVAEQIEALDVDPELERALEAGAVRLNEVIARCEETPAEAIDPATIPPEEEDDDDERSGGRDRDDDDDDDGDDPRRGGQGRDRGQGDQGGKGKATPPPSRPSPPAGGEDQAPEQGGEEDDPSGGLSPGSPAEGE